MLQQAVGEAARALAHVQAAQARDLDARGGQRAFELEPAAREVLGLRRVEQLQLGARGDVVAVLGDPVPGQAAGQAPLHASGDQALGLRAGGGVAAFHQEYVGAHGACPLLF
ncbi:hypothetical protein ALISP_0378 [Alicycliphilus sp. B1]|nr:hypothetical protein ALISP_0378 [Alicycliphilus sp. B1]